jgi:HPt (histidine-containing phosphotransfer) domain-containing protein
MSELKEVLSTLKKEYLEALPVKLKKIKELTQAKELDLLREEYHKLKGTGKTYGFPEISIVCAKLEALLQNTKTVETKNLVQAAELLEKMYQKYLKNEALDLNQDKFARELLALKVK